MNRIKEILDEKGIKQTWLAERLKKSINMVNAYAQKPESAICRGLVSDCSHIGCEREGFISRK